MTISARFENQLRFCDQDFDTHLKDCADCKNDLSGAVNLELLKKINRLALYETLIGHAQHVSHQDSIAYLEGKKREFQKLLFEVRRQCANIDSSMMELSRQIVLHFDSKYPPNLLQISLSQEL